MLRRAVAVSPHPVAAFAQPGPSFASLLGDTALPGRIDPDSTALRWDGGSRTYAEMKERALRVAKGFGERGLSPGDCVAVLAVNRPETLELLFACAYTGLTLVPISFRFVEDELRSVLDDCNPRMLVTQPAYADGARAAT